MIYCCVLHPLRDKITELVIGIWRACGGRDGGIGLNAAAENIFLVILSLKYTYGEGIWEGNNNTPKK